ncbi:MAG: prepilin peptidase [Planctomycetales bacterium]|nr:prepilin peptidase [Planctomycetales bacterium]
MSSAQIALTACVVVFTLVAALLDWRFKKLPNRITLPAFLAGLAFHLAWGATENGFAGSLQHLAFSLGGFATGFGVLFVLWVTGGGGGGDVKFMGALGAWLGASLTVKVFLVGAVVILFGSLATLTLSALKMGAMRTKEKYLSSDRSNADARVKRRLLPFAVSASLATWIVLALFGAPALTSTNATPAAPTNNDRSASESQGNPGVARHVEGMTPITLCSRTNTRLRTFPTAGRPTERPELRSTPTHFVAFPSRG